MFASNLLRIVFGVMFVVVGGVAWRMSADDDKVAPADVVAQQTKEQAKLKQLRPEFLKTMRLYVQATKAAYETDTVPFEQMIQAHRELLEAELQLADTAKDRIAVREAMVQNAKQMEAKIEALYQAGSRGGEAEKYSHAKALRLQAEIDLCHERIAALASD